ncbi:MAG: dihydrofolate reductase [Rikenellaceae bacterium]
MINIIVAIAQNGVIGGDNTLLWHIREDLQNFKRITSGHPVIMGRKTYESLGRPLPNRTNVVITRQLDLEIEGCTIVHSLDEALKLFTAEEDLFIIGGAEIYREGLEIAHKLYITRVHNDYKGDISFPEYDTTNWELTYSEHHELGEKDEHPFTFEEYHTTKWGIREASRQDIELLHTMAEESFRNTYKDIVSSEQMEFMMDMMYSIPNLHKQFDEGHIYYIMYNRAGENIGYGSIEPHGEARYHLQKLYLATPYKGKGYGAILFGHLLREIKRLCGGVPCRVELNVNKHNIATQFYFRQGMKIGESGDFIIEGTDFIRPDYILYKEL